MQWINKSLIREGGKREWVNKVKNILMLFLMRGKLSGDINVGKIPYISMYE